ncbi:MAG: oligosaccharyl transferase STT3 subunit [Archaeoglobus sp.]|nr:oligosaccharyl transferase STT3 subunit [Archaeoglobus sp.]
MLGLNKIFLFLSIIIALIFRLQHISKVLRGDLVLFNGYDSYYHLRLAEIIVKSGNRIGFDSYLNYPYGLKISWLPLYHWVISFPGLIFGFKATEVFAAFLPVVMGLVSVVVIYFIAMEIFQNEYVAFLSAFMTALTPKLVAIHSIGSSDYHGWNVAIFLLALLFFIRGINLRKEVIETGNNIRSHTNFLLSGVCIALLAASWLGASIYAIIIALLTMIAVRHGNIDYRGIFLIFIPPSLAAFLIPLTYDSVFQPLQLSFPFLAILAFLLVFFAANYFAEKRANSIIEKIQSERELERKSKKGKSKKSKSKKLKKSKDQIHEEEKEELISKYKNITSLLVIVLGILALIGLYFSPLKTIRLGINYILGISPYLPIIAEARSFQILLVALESGLLAFLVAVPFSIFHFLKKEDNSEFIFTWFVSAFILAMLQVRFSEILVVAVAIYSAYGICYLLQASNIPVLYPEEKGKRKEKRRKDRGRGEKSTEEKIWGKTEVVYSAIIILFIASTGAIFSITHFDLSEDWLSSLIELKELSPQTSGYLNPSEKPEYSVLSWWDYGNWILYISKRPVVCNNFQAGAKDAAKFFTTSNETLAMEILKKRGVRYIITDDRMMLGNETFKGKFQAIMRIAGFNTDNSTFVLDTYKKSMFYRLHVENGIDGIRLVSKHGSVKIFEVIGKR